MPWMRLDPVAVAVADALQVEIKAGDAQDEAAAAQVLGHLRQQLATGGFVAIQDHEGRTFIGTPDEATEHMMAS